MQDNCQASQSQGEVLWGKDEVIMEKYNNTKPANLEVYEFQVSGKTPKYINNSNGTIYKQFSQSQHQFYQYLSTIPSNDPRSNLKQYIPQYFGVEIQGALAGMQGAKEQEKEKEGNRRYIWIDHIASRSKGQSQPCQKFILLENLTFGYAIPNIIDLKLGIKKSKKSNAKFEKSTTNSHKFRINGLMVGLRQGETYSQCFVSKYHGQKITVQDTEAYLSLFFFSGQVMHKQLLGQIIDRLDHLIESFHKFTGIRFISSSLFIAYDAQNLSKYTVNLIDFDKYQHTEQQGQDCIIAEGLVNIKKFFQAILANQEDHLQRLLRKELQVFKAQHQVVPQEKIEKYIQ